ncbi:MAG: TlpA disulfide reductase family protein [Candidatus Acidiferrales bacterium]
MGIIKAEMKDLKRNLLTVLVLGGIVAMLVAFAMPDYRQGEASPLGRPAKDFALTLDGKQIHLSDLRGKVVVLNFWATWCPPCVEETPSLSQLQTRIAPLGGTVLGISMDDDEKAYERFLQAYNVDYPTYRDPTKKLAGEYGTAMYPETYVIDRQGRIARKIVGEQDWNDGDITAYMQELLAKK